jgi:hypothetical protein
MKKILLIVTAFLAAISTISCSDDDDNNRPEYQFPVINGYEARDVIGQKIGDTSPSPNNRNGTVNNDRDSSDFYFVMYPNPVNEVGMVHIKAPGDREVSYRFALVPARNKLEFNPYEAPHHDFSVFSDSVVFEHTFAGNDSIINMELQFTEQSGNSDELLPEGLYRLYLRADNLLLWYNVHLKY